MSRWAKIWRLQNLYMLVEYSFNLTKDTIGPHFTEILKSRLKVSDFHWVEYLPPDLLNRTFLMISSISFIVISSLTLERACLLISVPAVLLKQIEILDFLEKQRDAVCGFKYY